MNKPKDASKPLWEVALETLKPLSLQSDVVGVDHWQKPSSQRVLSLGLVLSRELGIGVGGNSKKFCICTATSMFPWRPVCHFLNCALCNPNLFNKSLCLKVFEHRHIKTHKTVWFFEVVGHYQCFCLVKICFQSNEKELHYC